MPRGREQLLVCNGIAVGPRLLTVSLLSGGCLARPRPCFCCAMACRVVARDVAMGRSITGIGCTDWGLCTRLRWRSTPCDPPESLKSSVGASRPRRSSSHPRDRPQVEPCARHGAKPSSKSGRQIAFRRKRRQIEERKCSNTYSKVVPRSIFRVPPARRPPSSTRSAPNLAKVTRNHADVDRLLSESAESDQTSLNVSHAWSHPVNIGPNRA